MKNQSPSSIHIKNGNVILDDKIVKGASVFIEDGRINSVGLRCPSANAATIDARGLFVSPGFIDTHIHGNPADILKYQARYGTTAIVVALSCAAPGTITGQIKEIRAFKGADDLGQAVLGVRLEGPFINKEKAGAQDKAFIKSPSVAELRRIIKRCGGLLKIMTLAPELDGALGLMRVLRKGRITASIGHSNANYRQAMRGVEAGITHATHLFNGMSRMNGKDAGAAGACLIDKSVMTEIIFDMVHVRPALLYLTLAMKENKSIILITDSVRAEARGFRKKGEVYRLKDGTIAGSDLTMIGAVKNVVTCCGAALTDAVKFTTINPARLLDVDACKGSITRGKDADIVLFDKYFDVKMTIARGRILYRKRGF